MFHAIFIQIVLIHIGTIGKIENHSFTSSPDTIGLSFDNEREFLISWSVIGSFFVPNRLSSMLEIGISVSYCVCSSQLESYMVK